MTTVHMCICNLASTMTANIDLITTIISQARPTQLLMERNLYRHSTGQPFHQTQQRLSWKQVASIMLTTRWNMFLSKPTKTRKLWLTFATNTSQTKWRSWSAAKSSSMGFVFIDFDLELLSYLWHIQVSSLCHMHFSFEEWLSTFQLDRGFWLSYSQTLSPILSKFYEDNPELRDALPAQTKMGFKKSNASSSDA